MRELCTLSQRHSRHAFRRAEHLVAATTTRRHRGPPTRCPCGREPVNWSDNCRLTFNKGASHVTRTSSRGLARGYTRSGQPPEEVKWSTAPPRRRVDLALIDVVLVQQPCTDLGRACDRSVPPPLRPHCRQWRLELSASTLRQRERMRGIPTLKCEPRLTEMRTALWREIRPFPDGR